MSHQDGTGALSRRLVRSHPYLRGQDVLGNIPRPQPNINLQPLDCQRD